MSTRLTNCLDRRFSIAPMMEWTHRHYRYFMRLMTRHTLLYTEMVTTGALLHGDRDRFLGFSPSENPLALQLGGSCPVDLARAAKIAEDYGYDEVNLNVGCPSDRVQAGRFGACLMKEPQLVAECVAAMRAKVAIPVTVKCRVGVDEQDSEEALLAFVETVHQAGCHVFIIHARKAWLKGLSPKQNRTVPPLCYDLVTTVKRRYPALTVVINGGIESIAQADKDFSPLDGIMLGRAAYKNPYLFASIDRDYYNASAPVLTRKDLIEAYLPYLEGELKRGTKLSHLTHHLQGLYTGQSGAKAWRQRVTTDKKYFLASLKAFA